MGDDEVREAITILEGLTDSELRALPLVAHWRNSYKNDGKVPNNVGDVEDFAAKQVKQYMPPPGALEVARFTVVQVGKPLLIKQVI